MDQVLYCNETSYYYKFDHQPNLTTFSIHGSVLAMTIDGLVLRIPQAALFKFETKLKSSRSYKLIFTTDNQNLTSGTLWHTFRNKTFIYPANPFPVTDDGKDSLSKRFRVIEEEESRAAVTLFRKIRIFVVTL
uniref:Multicopper oxidase n=1 Tax=Bursaphelenchus xylophilus TaxID=6326 RepID=A0A1I7RJ58_BURXY